MSQQQSGRYAWSMARQPLPDSASEEQSRKNSSKSMTYLALSSTNTYISYPMEYFDKKKDRSLRFMLQEPSEDDEYVYVEPVEKKTPKNVHEQFGSLYVARERFSAFAEEIGELRNTQIREDILMHCEQNSRKERVYQAFMNDESILRIINLRIQKMIKNKRIKKNWSEEDVQILVWVISKYADQKGFRDVEKDIDSQDWEAIASLIPGVTGESCMFKWLSLKKINLASNNWSTQESNLLSQLVNEKGFEGKHKDTKDWKLISQRLYFLNEREDKIFRNAKQCRQHWNCYLNPSLKKGPWKPQEDVQLLKCIKQNGGSKKWSQIVKYFDGRTQNALKNRYTLIIDKQKKYNKHRSEKEIIDEYLDRCYLDQFTNQNLQGSSSSSEEDVENSLSAMLAKEESIIESPEEPVKLERNHSLVEQPPVTPVKIERFTSFEALARSSIDFSAIKFGCLNNNGIFEKSPVDTEKTSSKPEPIFQLKRYNSSLF